MMTKIPETEQITYSTILVTPDMARSWLSNKYDGQRSINQKVVSEYSDAMKKGRWQLTHQPIAIDRLGRVVDGQHRLKAILDSGCSTQMTVAFNVDSESFYVMDRGYKRSSTQIARMAGCDWANQWNVSAVNTLLWDVTKLYSAARCWPEHELPDVLSHFKTQIEAAFPGGVNGSTQFRSGAIRGAILKALISKPDSTSRISEFLQVLATGNVIRGPEDNCANSLRIRLHALDMGAREDRFKAFGLTMVALRHFINGTNVVHYNNLAMPKRDPFPTFVDEMLSYETFKGFLARREKKLLKAL